MSRAVMPPGTAVARYTLDLTIDGAAPGRELRYRTIRVSRDGFDGQLGAGSLKRAKVDLSRGGHTVWLALARSTVDAVAVRLAWRERATTGRQWRDVEPVAGTPHGLVVVGDKRTPYALAEGGESVELIVYGPAWVRLLARPIEPSAGLSFPLVIERKRRVYRSYLLAHAPSRKARLSGQAELRLGQANQIVFAVGPGSHRLIARSDSSRRLLLRPQFAERSLARLPGAAAPDWRIRGRLASYYDSNILRYSDKFIQRFEQGEDSERFRVESLDDTVQRADLYLGRDFTGLAAKQARLGLAIEHRGYLRNSIKDWTRFSASFEKDFDQWEAGLRLTARFGN